MLFIVEELNALVTLKNLKISCFQVHFKSLRYTTKSFLEHNSLWRMARCECVLDGKKIRAKVATIHFFVVSYSF